MPRKKNKRKAIQAQKRAKAKACNFRNSNSGAGVLEPPGYKKAVKRELPLVWLSGLLTRNGQ